MNQSNSSSENDVMNVSRKVQSLPQIPSSTIVLKLPSKDYGPFCLKVLNDFIEHHNLPKDLPMPCAGLTTHEALSRIFDVILYSLGEEKRQEILSNLNEYKMGIPACFRN
jgi:hypothetical protein